MGKHETYIKNKEEEEWISVLGRLERRSLHGVSLPGMSTLPTLTEVLKNHNTFLPPLLAVLSATFPSFLLFLFYLFSLSYIFFLLLLTLLSFLLLHYSFFSHSYSYVFSIFFFFFFSFILISSPLHFSLTFCIILVWSLSILLISLFNSSSQFPLSLPLSLPNYLYIYLPTYLRIRFRF